LGSLCHFLLKANMHQVAGYQYQVGVLPANRFRQLLEYFPTMYEAPFFVPGKVSGSPFAPELQEPLAIQRTQMRVSYVDQAHQADYNRLTRIMHQGIKPSL
jgi:hypothetical protein